MDDLVDFNNSTCGWAVARAALLLTVLSIWSAARVPGGLQARAALLLCLSSLWSAARVSDVLRARAALLLCVFSVWSAARVAGGSRARANLIRSEFSLRLSAAVRSYLLPDLVVTGILNSLTVDVLWFRLAVDLNSLLHESYTNV